MTADCTEVREPPASPATEGESIPLARAVYVERGTMADERILPLAACDASVGPYFAMVLIPGEGRRL